MENKEYTSGVIGIDLGTTYSCVGVLRNSNIGIVKNTHGNSITPSYVAFTENETLVGDAAKKQAFYNPKNTIFDSKRLIGRSLSDSDVKKDILYWPFEVLEDAGEIAYRVKPRGETLNPSPKEIASEILKYLKASTKKSLERAINGVVITIPAYFNTEQRQTTIKSGTEAGFNVLAILNEPTAAAIAYGLDNRNENKQTVLVFDLGGGTLDISLLNIAKGSFLVLSTSGNTHLGGIDFDNRLVDFFKQEFKSKTGSDLSNDRYAVSRLRAHSERVKCALSSLKVVSICIDFLHSNKHFRSYISREQFNTLCDDLFCSTLEHSDQVLTDAKLNKTDVDEIIMIGGSTRILKIQELASDYFDNKELNTSINPDEAVARGATLYASKLTDNLEDVFKGLSLVDITPISLGIESEGEIMGTVVPEIPNCPSERLNALQRYMITRLV